MPVETLTRGYEATTSEVRELLDQEGDGITDYALTATLRLLSTANQLVQREFPHGYVVSDENGGIRIEWIGAGREVRLMMPGARDGKHYIYHEAGNDFDAVDVSPANLAQWLDWLTQA